jgi:hypothetical protein
MFDKHTQNADYYSSQPKGGSRDLSFLYEVPGTNNSRISNLYDAHVSLVIYGSDRRRWTCWTFVNTVLDSGYHDEHDHDHNKVDPSKVQSNGIKDTSVGDELDPIASDGVDDEVLAKTPTYDPRGYFLRTMHFRMRQILEEWTYLASKVEKSVKNHVRYILAASFPSTIFG